MRNLLIGVSLLLTATAYANPCDLLDSKGHINGIAYTTLEVNGKVYDVPMANKEYVSDLYLLKKAIKGDKDALELFLQGANERWFPIGDTKVIWLIAHKDAKFEVKST